MPHTLIPGSALPEHNLYGTPDGGQPGTAAVLSQVMALSRALSIRADPAFTRTEMHCCVLPVTVGDRALDSSGMKYDHMATPASLFFPLSPSDMPTLPPSLSASLLSTTSSNHAQEKDLKIIPPMEMMDVDMRGNSLKHDMLFPMPMEDGLL